MAPRKWLVPLAALALFLTPATAHAHGGWEGFLTLLVCAALSVVAFVIAIVQAIVLKVVRSTPARRVVGTITLTLGVLIGVLDVLTTLFEIDYTARHPAIWCFPLGALALAGLVVFFAFRLRRPAPAATSNSQG